MDFEEARPKPRPALTVGEDLSLMSVAELELRGTALAAEIERVNAELRRKRAHSAAADALFKPSDR